MWKNTQSYFVFVHAIGSLIFNFILHEPFVFLYNLSYSFAYNPYVAYLLIDTASS
jgi:hypothetical protein